MLQLFKKILKTGVVTEKYKAPKDDELEQLGIQIKRHIDKQFSGSIAIRQVDAGSCNGCELEIHALNNPYYDIERFGIHFVASPRHADVLLVTGPVSRHMQTALLRTYEATPNPKWVVAVGDGVDGWLRWWWVVIVVVVVTPVLDVVLVGDKVRVVAVLEKGLGF